MNADEIIRQLDLKPHPEGGHFRETFRDAASTAIYYLLKAGERSHWHRVAAAETWHWYAGHPLRLSISADGAAVRDEILGPHLSAGQQPQIVVPASAWQAAEPVEAWTLCGCTVAPPFDFALFEMAPLGWAPG